MHILNYINITVLLTNKTIIFGGCLIPLILFILINFKRSPRRRRHHSVVREEGRPAEGSHMFVFLGTMGWRKKQFE